MTSCKNLPIPLLYNIKMFFFPLSFITSSSFKCYNNNLQNGFLFPPWVTKEFTIKETFYIFNGITKIFNEECFFYCLFIVYLFFLLFLFFYIFLPRFHCLFYMVNITFVFAAIAIQIILFLKIGCHAIL